MVLNGPQANGSWGRPLWAEIDLDALAYNVACLKRQAGPAAVAAVVKANAYGHGALSVAKAALEADADRLAVICVEEGEQLRRGGIDVPILVMGHAPVGEARRIVGMKLPVCPAGRSGASRISKRPSSSTSISVESSFPVCTFTPGRISARLPESPARQPSLSSKMRYWGALRPESAGGLPRQWRWSCARPRTT